MGGSGWLIWGVGGTERSVTCQQQSAPQSTTAAYIHTDSHCAPCGDKDVAISECEEGAGLGCGRTGVRVGESGERVFHSLKPEWDLSLLYGLLHTTVRRGEFESFTEQPSPLGTSVKVKVSPQTHYHTVTHTHKALSTNALDDELVLDSLCRLIDLQTKLTVIL